jgi:hypothetical protein
MLKMDYLYNQNTPPPMPASSRTFFGARDEVRRWSQTLVLLWWSLAAAREFATTVRAEPALRSFPSIVTDDPGRRLQKAMIWTQPAQNQMGVAVAFRKTFDLREKPTRAGLRLFADARYVLWVNGAYVERGPARFQPNGPEYDTINLAPDLRAGRNVVALLVAGNLSGGKVMRHAPGLTARLEISGKELWQTDASWKWSDQTRFRQISATWADLRDTVIDARVEDGDWTQADYSDAAWKPAAPISGESWGALTARRIPLLRETPVAFTLAHGATLPVTLSAGQKLEFTTGRLVQAYPIITLEAAAGTELGFQPFGVRYIARAGGQTHFTIDTCGFSHGEITVKNGAATITGLKLIERLYPFDIVGGFQSNDGELNQLWAMCARSGQVLSEDSYVDCADRERVEWMDDDPPGSDITRTALAASDAAGRPVYSDPRLLQELVRRTALTLQPEGWVKAHTCSDRYDLHAKMEDRACEWVAGLRRYYDATGDAAQIREIWPAVAAQMNYFLDRRSPRGLVIAREWVMWNNPMGYETAEGTGLNAFVYRALVNAGFLGNVIGRTDEAAKFNHAAQDLAAAFNRVLWDEPEGTYYSGYDTDPAEMPPGVAKGKTGITPDWHLTEKPPTLANHLITPTPYPALFALDQNIVPPERRERVTKYLLTHTDPNLRTMFYYYYWKQLYAADQPGLDRQILDTMRQRWKAMSESPWQTSWEDFSVGSHAHIYGMFPGYFLSACVLGVRRDAPVAAKKLIIEPHLGDLTRAAGVVITEFGPVPVAWQYADGVWRFSFTIPDGIKATLRLPSKAGCGVVQLDGKTLPATGTGSRLELVVDAGRHEGSYPGVTGGGTGAGAEGTGAL